MSFGPRFDRAWRWYSTTCGLLAIAAALSWGIIAGLSDNGPVVVLTAPPELLTPDVPYRGMLRFVVSTDRRASCPGTRIATFSRVDPPVTIVLSRPITAAEIGPSYNRVSEIELPDGVFPGPWRFQSVIDSLCPTFQRQDVIADFNITVGSTGEQGR